MDENDKKYSEFIIYIYFFITFKSLKLEFGICAEFET